MAKGAPVTVRLDDDTLAQLGKVAGALARSKSWVIEQAVREFVATQAWQLAAIDEGIKAADAGRLLPHADVAAWVQSWAEDDELPMPECG